MNMSFIIQFPAEPCAECIAVMRSVHSYLASGRSCKKSPRGREISEFPQNARGRTQRLTSAPAQFRSCRGFPPASDVWAERPVRSRLTVYFPIISALSILYSTFTIILDCIHVYSFLLEVSFLRVQRLRLAEVLKRVSNEY